MVKEDSGHRHSTKLGFWAIVALAFFGITGGPYSNEPVVQSLGLGLTWVAQFAVLVFHGFPLSLCCLEQTLLIPVNGGPLIWSRASMGPLASHIVAVTGVFSYITQVGYLGTISLSYIEEMFPIFFEHHMWVRHVSIAACIIICSIVDVGKLGRFLEVILILSLLPAFALVVVGVYNKPSSEWFSGFLALPDTIDLFNGFMQLYWMNSGIANIMVRVEDAESPRVFRRAVMLNVVLASLAYVVPMWGGQLVDGSVDFSNWHSGYFHAIAVKHLPVWFSWWIVAGAVMGSIGLLIAQVVVTVEFCSVCAELGSLPRFLLSRDGSHSNGRTGVAVTAIGITLAIFYRSDELVQYVGVSYALFIATHFITFYKLRFMYTDRARPFKVGVEQGFGLLLLSTLPVLFIVAPLVGTPYDVFVVTSVFVVGGILCFPFTAEFTCWRESWRAVFEKRAFKIQPGLLQRNCLVPIELLVNGRETLTVQNGIVVAETCDEVLSEQHDGTAAAPPVVGKSLLDEVTKLKRRLSLVSHNTSCDHSHYVHMTTTDGVGMTSEDAANNKGDNFIYTQHDEDLERHHHHHEATTTCMRRVGVHKGVESLSPRRSPLSAPIAASQNSKVLPFELVPLHCSSAPAPCPHQVPISVIKTHASAHKSSLLSCCSSSGESSISDTPLLATVNEACCFCSEGVPDSSLQPITCTRAYQPPKCEAVVGHAAEEVEECGFSSVISNQEGEIVSSALVAPADEEASSPSCVSRVVDFVAENMDRGSEGFRCLVHLDQWMVEGYMNQR
eukprot:GDKJ01021121.1.p1 GENE.GDKJ01021121.1~~GDKJ01021121.1.p1  ORF type:complete len:783 (-),score=152.00 GDKJ01021121.1:109-2457(-)